jgi:predicted CDP-diglyceride synthetase/phosphatidate cytidylyltransferase
VSVLNKPDLACHEIKILQISYSFLGFRTRNSLLLSFCLKHQTNLPIFDQSCHKKLRRTRNSQLLSWWILTTKQPCGLTRHDMYMFLLLSSISGSKLIHVNAFVTLQKLLTSESTEINRIYWQINLYFLFSLAVYCITIDLWNVSTFKSVRRKLTTDSGLACFIEFTGLNITKQMVQHSIDIGI